MRKRVQCPGKCDDTSGNNLLLYEDSDTFGYCFQCQKSYSIGEHVASNKTHKGKAVSEIELAAVRQLPIRALDLIPEEICEKYGVRCSVSEEDGQIDRIYYPYGVERVTGYKARCVPKDFFAVGKLEGLFGQAQAKKGGKMLVICEGEKDQLAIATMHAKAGKDYSVVSIPNGANQAGQIDNQTLKELEFLQAHTLIVLFMDDDKPGVATAQALAELLCATCRVKIIKTSKKDAYELLEAGLEQEYWNALRFTPDYSPQKIIRGSEITLEQLMKPKPAGLQLPYPKLNAKLQGLRKGEITLITGGSGLGKTQLVRELGYDLVTVHNQKVANIMLETPFEDVARSYIAMDNGVPPYKLIFNPKCITKDRYEDSYKKLIASDKFHFFAHWGSLDSEVLLNKCRFFVQSLGVDWIILDHISLAVAGVDTDERKTLDMAFEALTRLCVETGVGVIVVMHLKRVQGKSWAAGDEVELTDLRGCVDADTEFLSDSGWKKISDHTPGDKVWVVDSSLKGQFASCDYVQYPCKEFWSIKTNRLSMCLSDEHRIAYVTERCPDTIKFIHAEDAVKLDKEQATGFRGLIPTTMKGTKETSKFPGGEAALRVQVMFNADGWTKPSGRGAVRVKKQRKVERARQLLAAYTEDWFEFSGGPGYTEFAFTPPMKKGFDSSYYRLCQEDIEIICDELKHWDGELSSGSIGSVDKREVDFFQFVYALCGRRGQVRHYPRTSSFGGKYAAQDYYEVKPTEKEKMVSFRNCPNSKRKIERVPSVDGLKYCFTSPTGMWLARRDGKIFVTGNTAGAEQMSWTVIAVERNSQDEQVKDISRIRVLKNRTTGFLGVADELSFSHETGRLAVLHREY